MNLEVPITFSKDELWLLQVYIRHDMPQRDTWSYPPCSIAFNDALSDAILRCEDKGLNEYTLVLSRGELLAIDFLIPQHAKSTTGMLLGRSILLKSYRARRSLAGTDADPVDALPTADEPTDVPTYNQTVSRLHDWLRMNQPKKED